MSLVKLLKKKSNFYDKFKDRVKSRYCIKNLNHILHGSFSRKEFSSIK